PSRNRIAALNTTDGTAIAWDPGIWGGTTTTVLDVLSTDDAIYVAGDFNRTGPIVAGSPTRNFIAAFDPTTGAETAWNPSASNKVYTMAISGTAMYIGGSFGGVNGVARSRIAAIDPITGEPTSCNPDVSAAVGQAIIVNDLLIDGTTLYVAGAFTSINGTSRNRIAAIDTTTCTLTTWNPSANSEVKAIDVDASNIYVGGAFTNIGGSVRNRIAAVSRTTGIATSWNPNANNAIDTLDLEGGTVYIGGRFTTIGGILRNRIAALSTAGVLSLWNPNSDAAVNSIDVDGAIIYVGGAFATIGGAS
ncbi:TPA: hypothetical protein DCZ32_01680, partial [Candidatus Uhrbacteria bacterium]|nr:hypothetical protein [Candidatus Uhrbacteria bacterium]